MTYTYDDLNRERERRRALQNDAARMLDEAEAAGRDLTANEDARYQRILRDIRDIDEVVPRLEARLRATRSAPAPIRPEPMDNGEISGDSSGTRGATVGGLAGAMQAAGWSLRGRPSVRLDLRSTFPTADMLRPLVDEGGVVPLGRDERFLFPHLRSQSVDGETSVSDFRQTGSRTVTGTVERAIDATTAKASLDVAVTYATEELKQLAVLLKSIPNVVLETLPLADAFFNQEARYQLFRALDAHVVAQIAAATPPFGNTGTGLVAQVRNGIAAMRANGYNPSILVVNPTDAVALDLFVQPGTADYLFPTGATGSSSPLWGLRVVEHATPAGSEPPMLIDAAALGMLYPGALDVQADPFTEFDKNLTTLRFEMNALFHVRAAAAAYEIKAA